MGEPQLDIKNASVSYGKESAKYLDKDFWIKSSDTLYTQGKAPGLADTQRARMPSFFETSNVNLPKYG